MQRSRLKMNVSSQSYREIFQRKKNKNAIEVSIFMASRKRRADNKKSADGHVFES